MFWTIADLPWHWYAISFAGFLLIYLFYLVRKKTIQRWEAVEQKNYLGTALEKAIAQLRKCEDCYDCEEIDDEQLINAIRCMTEGTLLDGVGNCHGKLMWKTTVDSKTKSIEDLKKLGS